MVKLLSVSAPAKVNLFLRVTGRRADGYHELDSVFLPISLADRLRIEMRPSSSRRVSLQCDAPGLPGDDRNLAVRAASAFMKEFGVNAEVLLDLHKEIPIGAGLGGGSSDAGAVLRAMAALSRVDEAARLALVALKLGADVPFFLNPVLARVGGIGERIQPLAAPARFALVLAVPPVEISTAEVFAELKPENWSGPGTDIDIRAVLESCPFSTVFVNDLEEVAVAHYPIIAELKGMLIRAGAEAASMTGSGSAVFGIFRSVAEARVAASELRRQRPDTRILAATPL